MAACPIDCFLCIDEECAPGCGLCAAARDCTHTGQECPARACSYECPAFAARYPFMHDHEENEACP